ncbi:MAG: hypothetical protein J6V38_07855 [Kiritimatiellae bacterium]|nr:hypothetical protein [Kiritimatiellia bacterium]
MSDLIDRSKLPTIRITIPAHLCDASCRGIVEIVANGFQTLIDSAPAVDAVPRDEYDALLKRFRHLLESDFIRSFDEYDPRTQTYKRDIIEADDAVRMVRCKDCEHWQQSRRTPLGSCYCECLGVYRPIHFYCAYGRKIVKND